MTEISRGIDRRTLAFAAIVLVALLLRVADLGSMPLGDAEAQEALNAAGARLGSPFWDAAQRLPSSSGAYKIGTWILFEALGSGNALARVLPAVLGSLVVIGPWLLRRRLGVSIALCASLLLAISPILVATSRTAGGGSAALLGLTLAAAFLVLAVDGDLEGGKAVVAVGASLALGMGGGPQFFFGLAGLGVAGLVLYVAWRGDSRGRGWETASAVLPQALGIGVIGALVLSSAAGLQPQGWTALGESVRRWLVGWITPDGMHPATPAATLLFYDPLIFAFGILGLIRAWRLRDAFGVGLGLWAVSSLLLAIAYAGRTPDILMWCVVPLALLAGRALLSEAEAFLAQPSPWGGMGVASVLLVLALYAGMQLTAYAEGIGPGVSPLNPGLRLVIALGALVVGALVAVLVGFGWNWRLPRSGVALTAGLVLLLVTISSGTWLNFERGRMGAQELWAPSAPTDGVLRLEATLASLSTSATGVREELPLLILSKDPAPSVVWAARALDRFETSDSGRPESPPLVLTPLDGPPYESASEYLGQTIPVQQRWDFPGPVPTDLLRWWLRRDLPTVETTWVLLVRSDIATQGESLLGEGASP